MSEPLTKSQINKLGERLRTNATADDLRLLSAYRDSHDVALEATIREIDVEVGLAAVGRRKTNQSIIEKLRRQSTRLNQMQDIVGCRLVVDGPLRQQTLTDRLVTLFDGAEVDDRRARPSHGYRAIHVVRRHVSGRLVEIQIRTELQDLWAQCSERMADLHGIEVKYGGGPQEVVTLLARLAAVIADIEAIQMAVSTEFAQHRVREAPVPGDAYATYRGADALVERMRAILGAIVATGVSSAYAR